MFQLKHLHESLSELLLLKKIKRCLSKHHILLHYKEIDILERVQNNLENEKAIP